MISKTTKRKLLLLLVIYSVISPNIYILSVYALWNNYPRYGPDGYTTLEARVNSYKMFPNYGAHDWVFDSAINLIDEQPIFRNYINSWLYDYTLGIPFVMFDGTGGNWWHNTGNQKPYRTTYSYLFPTATPDAQKDKQWMFARRYYQGLTGTKGPDTIEARTSIEILGTNLIAEKYSITGNWITSKAPSNRDHAALFEWVNNDWERVIVGKGKAPDHIKECGEEAFKALIHVEDYLDENCQWNTRKGKYEAAARIFGEMTHYFGDLASPGHVVAWDSVLHDSWENYMSSSFGMFWDEGERNWNGGPYELINLQQYLNTRGWALRSDMTPYVCAVKMAYYTFTGFDRDPSTNKAVIGPLGAENLNRNGPSTPEEYQRAKELMANAIYFTTCAMLNIMSLARTNNLFLNPTTIIEQRNPEPCIYNGVPISNNEMTALQDMMADMNWIQQKQIDPNEKDLGLNLSMFSSTLIFFLPFGLIILPELLYVILSNYREEKAIAV